MPVSLNPEITHNNEENCSETETQDNPLTSWQILSGSGTLLITSLQSDSAKGRRDSIISLAGLVPCYLLT